MPDRPALIDGAIAKIERSYEHFEGLRAEFLARRNDHTYGVFADVDPQTGEMVFRVRFPYELRLRWATIIGDVVHELHSALDQLAHQLVLLNKGEWTHKTAFPIFTHKANYRNASPKMVDGMSDTAKALIERLQPYHGGSDRDRHPLALLYELSVHDKHRFPALSFFKVSDGFVIRGDAAIPLPPDPLTADERMDETEWFRVPDGVNVKFNFRMHIAFQEGEEEPAPGMEVEEVLHALIDFVQATIEQDFGPLFPIQRRLWRFNVEKAVLPTITKTGGCPRWQIHKSWTTHGVHFVHDGPGHPGCEFPQVVAEASP